jgi:hypothetical protein
MAATITAEQREKVLAMANDGRTAREIALAVGISKDSASRLARSARPEKTPAEVRSALAAKLLGDAEALRREVRRRAKEPGSLAGAKAAAVCMGIALDKYDRLTAPEPDHAAADSVLRAVELAIAAKREETDRAA